MQRVALFFLLPTAPVARAAVSAQVWGRSLTASTARDAIDQDLPDRFSFPRHRVPGRMASSRERLRCVDGDDRSAADSLPCWRVAAILRARSGTDGTRHEIPERCPRGRRGSPAKGVCGQKLHRGFESLSLRHLKPDQRLTLDWLRKRTKGACKTRALFLYSREIPASQSTFAPHFLAHTCHRDVVRSRTSAP